jgi:subtilase family serine protease
MKHMYMPDSTSSRWFGLLLIAILPTGIVAQPNRISGRIDANQWTAVRGDLHPNARSEYDRGKADASLQMNSVMLVFKPSGSQQADLARLLNNQQDPLSGDYRRWLTPEEYAERFGLSKSDIDKIAGWAQSQGLKVTIVARARSAITLAGSAAEVGNAFHTEIHLYQMNGEMHYANATEPSIPAAIQDVVAAVHGLHNFRLKPKARKLTALGLASDGVSPAYTSSTTGNHYLAPDDFATIFDVNPLYSAGINGASQKIVIVGQSQILASHLSTFTTYFGMQSVNLTTVLVPGTQDPGVSESDEEESDLDLQWASAVARGGSLVFVYSYDVTDAVQYAIDQNLAPVLSMSYGECEESVTRTDATTMRLWAQQANSQGITWVSASGDSGAADCYRASSGSSGGSNNDLTLAVDLPASVPEVTGIGGTTFNEGSTSYWNSTNSSTKASAKSYIPEVAWNDSVSDGGPAASGGGASQFFSKPSWQTGTGVPNDGARDVPDLAFPASADHDGYLVYTTSGGQTGWYVFGGTSCGTPSFSGVLALLNQYLVASGYLNSGGLGNINSKLYALTTSTPTAFHDVTSGNNIVIATSCVGPRCTGTTTSSGYNAGIAYDQVTGLGSLDVYAFIAAWYPGGPLSRNSPNLAVSANPSSLTTAGTTALTATVTNPNGNTPTGTVTFASGTTVLGVVTLSTAGGSATGALRITGSAAGIALGANTITAVYQGDSANNQATATVLLTVVGLSSVTPSITALTNAASYR